MGLWCHPYSLFTGYYSPSLVHTRRSTVRLDAGQAHAVPSGCQFTVNFPEPGRQKRFFRRPARLGSTPVAGQVLRMDAIGRLTAPPLSEVVLATISVCGNTPRPRVRGFLLDTLSGTTSSARMSRTECVARSRGFASQTPPPVSAPCILSALSVAA